MRTIILFLFIFFTIRTIIGQNLPIVGKEHPIYQFEARLMNGDKSALFDIAPYFDSEKKVIEFLGYHRLETTESQIAKRIVLENCLFVDNEIKITNSTTTKQFVGFLNINKDKIIFSKLATSFLITPLDQRKVNYKIRTISETRKKELQDSVNILFSSDWVKRNRIDTLVIQKNPISLLLIASEFYKIRNRFNRYYFYGEEFTNLLQYLTGTEIGVDNGQKEISWHIDKDYDPSSKLNLLIYFSKYYHQYIWDETKSVFVNPHQKVSALSKEERLFQLLNSKNDSIAIDAFTQLTTCNPQRVIQIADEYKRVDEDKNFSIPLFPYNFLKQLVVLTDYCRTNNIDFIGTQELQSNISLLRTEMPFSKRRNLEDKLISTLTLEDITAFEYWAIIYEDSWDLTYSAGRILDIFYSKNWSNLIANKKYLDCYLKKSALFDNLGIIGICNNYLNKFSNSSQNTLALLNNYQTNDSVLKEQIRKIISLNTGTTTEKKKSVVKLEGNKNYKVKNLKKKLTALTRNVQDSSKTDDTISKILSQISYSQIPTALEIIEKYRFQTTWKKYSFMKRDWGFFMAGDFDKKETRDEFLKLYSKYTEYQLYAYYLDQAAINYKTTDNSLDYDKIYELLKYDVVVAFVGGGGGMQDNEVYALVKLLELTFKTTLGYPSKLCSSNNIYACNSDKRAKSWMKFITDNKLLKRKHNEPISFH